MVRYENPPGTLIVNDRLANDLRFMHEYTKREKQEVAGFLIRALHGGVGVISPVLGEGLSVGLNPAEELHEGETYLGTAHTHPYSSTFSIHDVMTFLADSTEKVSMNMGAKGEINLLVKTDSTESVLVTDIQRLKGIYEKADVSGLADNYLFLYYRSKGDKKMTLVNKVDKGGDARMDDFCRTIMGEKEIPSYSIKKVKSGRNNMGLLDARCFVKR